MKQLTINIADNKFDVFLEFIKTLDYVKVADEEEKALGELQNSLIQVKLMKEGKLPKQKISSMSYKETLILFLGSIDFFTKLPGNQLQIGIPMTFNGPTIRRGTFSSVLTLNQIFQKRKPTKKSPNPFFTLDFVFGGNYVCLNFEDLLVTCYSLSKISPIG